MGRVLAEHLTPCQAEAPIFHPTNQRNECLWEWRLDLSRVPESAHGPYPIFDALDHPFPENNLEVKVA